MSGYIRYSFAVDGERVPIDASTQPSGVISLQAGYPSGYSLPQANPLSKNIERTKFNELMYLVTTAIRILQQQGAPDFIEASENGGVAYEYTKYARCFRAGVCYESLVNNNADVPPSSKWKVIDDLATDLVRGLIKKATPTQLLNAVVNVWPDAATIVGNAEFDVYGSNGFTLRLPDWIGGFILKCGLHVDTNPGDTTITFTDPFPNNCFGLLPVPEIPTPTNYDSTTIDTRANGYVTIGRISGGVAGTYNVFWLAVGN